MLRSLAVEHESPALPICHRGAFPMEKDGENGNKSRRIFEDFVTTLHHMQIFHDQRSFTTAFVRKLSCPVLIFVFACQRNEQK